MSSEHCFTSKALVLRLLLCFLFVNYVVSDTKRDTRGKGPEPAKKSANETSDESEEGSSESESEEEDLIKTTTRPPKSVTTLTPTKVSKTEPTKSSKTVATSTSSKPKTAGAKEKQSAESMDPPTTEEPKDSVSFKPIDPLEYLEKNSIPPPPPPPRASKTPSQEWILSSELENQQRQPDPGTKDANLLLEGKQVENETKDNIRFESANNAKKKKKVVKNKSKKGKHSKGKSGRGKKENDEEDDKKNKASKGEKPNHSKIGLQNQRYSDHHRRLESRHENNHKKDTWVKETNILGKKPHNRALNDNTQDQNAGLSGNNKKAQKNAANKKGSGGSEKGFSNRKAANNKPRDELKPSSFNPNAVSLMNFRPMFARPQRFFSMYKKK